MGYESALHLIDLKIRAESVPLVRRALANPGKGGTTRIRYFLERAVIDSGGFLAFKASDDREDPYVPDEDDGTVPALYGKWYEAEKIARWLRRHSESGGRLVLHSIEADGEAFGWEFDGRGRMRHLRLVPVGKWE
jgi:hypothetical protein